MLQPTYSKYKVRELISKVKNQEIILPTIQRDIVWTQKEVKSLQESIMKGFPIGAILLHKIEGKQHVYLLDGLQRTSSIIEIIDNKYKNITIEALMILESAGFKFTDFISKERIVEMLNESGSELMSLKHASERAEMIMKNYTDEIDECHSAKLVKFFEHLSEYLPSEEYEIPYIEFEATFADATEAFIRLNTTGKKLDEFEILDAKWSEHEIRMTESKHDKDFIKAILSKYDFVKDLSISYDSTKFNLRIITPGDVVYGIAKNIVSDSSTPWFLKDLFYDKKKKKIINLKAMLLLLKYIICNHHNDKDDEFTNDDVGIQIKNFITNNKNGIENIKNAIINTAKEISEYWVFTSKTKGGTQGAINIDDSYLIWFLLSAVKKKYSKNITTAEKVIDMKKKECNYYRLL